MIRLQELSSIAVLLAASALAPAQIPAPAAAPEPAPQAYDQTPAPPAPPAVPAPAVAPVPPLPPEPPDVQAIPMPVIAPMPPMPPEDWGFDLQDKIDMARDKAMAAQDKIMSSRDIQREVERATAQAERIATRMNFDWKMDTAPMLFAQNFNFNGRGGRQDGLYDRGKNSLDEHRWDQALDSFNEVITRGGPLVEGALYWKAYTLNKLGRRNDALAALAQLRKQFPSSRWLDDAKALEVEVQQASGTAVAPEGQNDDDIKLLALNGLMQSDPDRGFPVLERLLRSAQTPRLKKRALFVLAESGQPRAQQMLEQIARGNGNPDLQLAAISYMSSANRKPNGGQILAEIYSSSNDAAVKRAVIDGLMRMRDKDRLLQIARTEKNDDLRLEAIRRLGATAAQPEMWQLYQQETSPDIRRQILASIASSGNSERLLEVARTDKDPTMRYYAVEFLTSVRSTNIADRLVEIYGSDQDQKVKHAVINVLASQKNPKMLIELARKEKDPELKRYIVERIVDMKSPEATAFLEEILK
jgi:tetratricopeptide (TPR) repeat protein